MPPAELLTRIGNSGKLDIGEHPSIASHQLVEALRKEGLHVVEEDRSSEHFLPLDRTTGTVWIIENDADQRVIIERMLRAGVPVEIVEVG